MDSEDDDQFMMGVLASCAMAIHMKEKEAKKKRKKRLCWVKPWLQRRPIHGQFEALMSELRLEDPAVFTNFTRVQPDLFQEILANIQPLIEKQFTHYRKPLEPGLKLAITLRYMATGDSYKSLSYGFRVAHNTISLLVPEVCQAIIDKYYAILELPKTEDAWKKIAEDFESRWNFPHCIGAIDGKHVSVKCPPLSGSLYYNYKHFFSLVLMALVDSNYKFIYVNIGAHGSGSDGGVFATTELHNLLDQQQLQLPPAEPLPGGQEDVPYFIIGDEAFPLRPWLLKPIPRRGLGQEERIFNYRTSRARRVVENAFGILSAKFRCLRQPMAQTPDRVKTIVLACCILHNLIRDRTRIIGDFDREDPDTHEVIPGAWRNEPQMSPLVVQGWRGNTASKAGKALRDYMVEYFNSEAGRVPWQDRMV